MCIVNRALLTDLECCKNHVKILILWMTVTPVQVCWWLYRWMYLYITLLMQTNEWHNIFVYSCVGSYKKKTCCLPLYSGHKNSLQACWGNRAQSPIKCGFRLLLLSCIKDNGCQFFLNGHCVLLYFCCRPN